MKLLTTILEIELKKVLLILSVFFSIQSYSQNLLPLSKSSFEDTVSKQMWSYIDEVNNSNYSVWFNLMDKKQTGLSNIFQFNFTDKIKTKIGAYSYKYQTYFNIIELTLLEGIYINKYIYVAKSDDNQIIIKETNYKIYPVPNQFDSTWVKMSTIK